MSHKAKILNGESLQIGKLCDYPVVISLDKKTPLAFKGATIASYAIKEINKDSMIISCIGVSCKSCKFANKDEDRLGNCSLRPTGLFLKIVNDGQFKELVNNAMEEYPEFFI